MRPAVVLLALAASASAQVSQVRPTTAPAPQPLRYVCIAAEQPDGTVRTVQCVAAGSARGDYEQVARQMAPTDGKSFIFELIK